MSRLGDRYENRITGERAVVLRGDEDGDGAPYLVHLTVTPGGALAGEHVHPALEERFEVIAGQLGSRLAGVERTLEEGESMIAPAGIAHDWWNSGDGDAQVLVEITPPEPRFMAMIANLWGLANIGRTNAKGMPSPLRLALTGAEFADVIRFTRPPAPVQGALFGLAGPIARRRGLRARYPELERPHGRATPDPAVLARAGLAPSASAR